MDVILARTESGMTGTQWIINSQLNLQKKANREEILIALTAAMIENQKSGKPVHEWSLAEFENIQEWHPYSMLVEEFMTTDVFTVHENDLPELVSDIMAWRKIKYLPVENEKGRLKGLVTYKDMLNYFSKDEQHKKKNSSVKNLMQSNPVFVEPEATVNTALQLMKKNKVDCLPVVKNDKLVGIITEGNFIQITTSLLQHIEKSQQRSKAKKND